MKGLTRKLEKEFDGLVKIQKSMMNPGKHTGIVSLIDVFGIFSRDRHSLFLALPPDKYNSVSSAYEAISLYGKRGKGKEIYNEHKRNYVNLCLPNSKNY